MISQRDQVGVSVRRPQWTLPFVVGLPVGADLLGFGMDIVEAGTRLIGGEDGFAEMEIPVRLLRDWIFGYLSEVAAVH